jgi:hypothetical protein
MALFGFDFKSVVVTPFTRVVTSIRQTINTATHILEVVNETVEDAIGIYHEIKTFELKPHWKIRAVSVPQAVDNIKELAEVPTRIVIAVRDLVQRVRNSVEAFRNPVAEAEAAAEEAGALEGGLLRLFPRIAALLGRAISRVLAVAGLIVQLVIDVDNAVADIHTLVGQLRTAITSLNHLDAVFLQQNNKRRIVELADGTKMKIRVGNLHS